MWHNGRYFCYSGYSYNSKDLAYSLAFGATKQLYTAILITVYLTSMEVMHNGVDCRAFKFDILIDDLGPSLPPVAI